MLREDNGFVVKFRIKTGRTGFSITNHHLTAAPPAMERVIIIGKGKLGGSWRR